MSHGCRPAAPDAFIRCSRATVERPVADDAVGHAGGTASAACPTTDSDTLPPRYWSTKKFMLLMPRPWASTFGGTESPGPNVARPSTSLELEAGVGDRGLHGAGREPEGARPRSPSRTRCSRCRRLPPASGGSSTAHCQPPCSTRASLHSAPPGAHRFDGATRSRASLPHGQSAIDGQAVVVTGAGRGFGRCHAELIASRGAKVVVADYGVQLDGSGSSQRARPRGRPEDQGRRG